MRKTTRHVAAAFVAAAALAACGGGDHESKPATEQVPDSASDSIDGFIAYLQKLVVSEADTLEPVDTSKVTPPTDETSEPKTID